jgi:hypothetical protein
MLDSVCVCVCARVSLEGITPGPIWISDGSIHQGGEESCVLQSYSLSSDGVTASGMICINRLHRCGGHIKAIRSKIYF